MAGSYDNTDQIDTQVVSNDSVKISGSTLKFGALRFNRGPAVPPNSFDRNGDIFLLDDTARRPQEALQSNIQPSTVGLYQKIPAAIPTGPVVYDTSPGGAEFPAGGNLGINGVLVTINPGDTLANDILDGGFFWNEIEWDSDESSRQNIIGVSTAIANGVPLPDGFSWRSKDNTDIKMSAAELISFVASMLSWVNHVYQVAWFHKENVV